MLIFCNRSKITDQLTRDPRWSFISSHFGKIVRYIRTHHVLFPLVLDQQKSHHDEKNKMHRISALKWAEQAGKIEQQQFVITQGETLSEVVNGYAESYSKFLKVNYQIGNDMQTFKKDLTTSLGTLRNQYKLAIHENDFAAMVEGFTQANLQ